MGAALHNIADGSPVDVMLVVWDEPHREWHSFCRVVRDRDSSPCPFQALVVISKEATREHVQLARDAGVDEFLALPFSTDGFRQRLLAIVRQRRGFVDVAGYFGPCRRRGAMARMLGVERRGRPSKLIDPYTGAIYLDC
jgi:two-component system, chemotaxis family, chemotaxis protein CheY